MKKINQIWKALLLLIAIGRYSSAGLYAQPDSTKVDIFEMTLEDLMKVEIYTAGKKSEKISEIPASVVLITRADIERYGYQTLQEVLENVPGLYAINDYGWNDVCFGVRGFNTGVPRSLAIMINGVSQIFEADKTFIVASLTIPVEIIERIEIVRGPMSVIYGSGAFLGAINIITSSVEQNNKYHGSASTSYGSNNTIKFAAICEGNKNDFKFRFNMGANKSDGLDFKYSDMTKIPDIILPAYGLSVDKTTENALNNKGKYFDFSGKYKNFSVGFLHKDFKQDAFMIYPAVEDNQYQHRKTTSLFIAYENKFSEKFTINARYLYKYKEMNYIFDWFSNTFSGHMERPENDHYGEINAFVSPNDKFNISTGISMSRYMVNGRINIINLGPTLDEITRHTPNGSYNASFFTQADYTLFDKLKIIAGVRADYLFEFEISKEYGFSTVDPVTGLITPTYLRQTIGDNLSFVPRFAALYSINENNVIKLLYGEAITQPPYVYLITNLNDQIAEDDKLKPEIIRTIELNYISSLFKSKLTVNFSVFRNMMNELIMSSANFDDAGNWIPFHVNLGKMITNGAELSIQSAPIANLLFDISATYQQSTNEFTEMEGLDVILSPDLLGYFKASYLFPAHIILSVNATYVDKMKPAYDVRPSTADPAIPAGWLGDDVKSYFLLGANLRISKLFRTGLYLNFRVSNLLDQEIRYPTFSTSPKWTDKGTIGPGMQMLFTLGYKFKK